MANGGIFRAVQHEKSGKEIVHQQWGRIYFLETRFSTHSKILLELSIPLIPAHFLSSLDNYRNFSVRLLDATEGKSHRSEHAARVEVPAADISSSRHHYPE